MTWVTYRRVVPNGPSDRRARAAMLAVMELVLFTIIAILIGIAAELWGIDTRDFEPSRPRPGADFRHFLI